MSNLEQIEAPPEEFRRSSIEVFKRADCNGCSVEWETSGIPGPWTRALKGPGHRKDQESHSRRTGKGLLRGRCGLGAETVADRRGQSRLIHLPFYAGDDLFFDLDAALLFHEASLL